MSTLPYPEARGHLDINMALMLVFNLKGKGEYIKGGTATLPVGGSHSITSKL